MGKTYRNGPRGRVRENTKRQMREERTEQNPGIPSYARAEFSLEEAFSVEDMEKSFTEYLDAKETPASYGGGWMGTAGQVRSYLDTVNADRDEQGRFLVGGGIAGFMGMSLDNPNTEVVLGSDAYYLAGGRKCSLAGGLRSTSYGFGVMVIS